MPTADAIAKGSCSFSAFGSKKRIAQRKPPSIATEKAVSTIVVLTLDTRRSPVADLADVDLAPLVSSTRLVSSPPSTTLEVLTTPSARVATLAFDSVRPRLPVPTLVG